MTRYLLDTDTASYILRGHAVVTPPIFGSDDSVIISTISVTELQYGAVMVGAPTSLVSRVHKFLDQIESVAFDDKAAESAAQVRSHLKSIGKPSGAYDTLIAGHALALNAVLVTNNVRHFERVPGLLMQNWTER